MEDAYQVMTRLHNTLHGVITLLGVMADFNHVMEEVLRLIRCAENELKVGEEGTVVLPSSFPIEGGTVRIEKPFRKSRQFREFSLENAWALKINLELDAVMAAESQQIPKVQLDFELWLSIANEHSWGTWRHVAKVIQIRVLQEDCQEIDLPLILRLVGMLPSFEENMSKIQDVLLAMEALLNGEHNASIDLPIFSVKGIMSIDVAIWRRKSQCCPRTKISLEDVWTCRLQLGIPKRKIAKNRTIPKVRILTDIWLRISAEGIVEKKVMDFRVFDPPNLLSN